MSGSTNNALARATLIRQPPESDPIVLLSIAGEKPKPPKIVAALD
jgi:hypothetical protein